MASIAISMSNEKSDISMIRLGKNIFIKRISDNSYYVFNSKNKKSYEIGKNEYETLLTMKNEQSFGNLYEKNRDRMSKEQLMEFCKAVGKLGFLEGSTSEHKLHITKIKFGLFNPSRYFDEKSIFIRIMYFVLTKMPVIALLIGGLSFFFGKNENAGFMESAASFSISFDSIVFSLMMVFVITAFHEFGHMCMAIHYGVPVPEIGLMLYWFAPCAYADVSAIHFIKDKSKKIMVLMAGVYTHIMWIGLGLAAYNFMPEYINYTIPFIVINLGLIFINVTFYLKLDGYYVLTEIFDEPLLREHSMAFYLNKEMRRKMKMSSNYCERILYILVGFISLIYIPALIMSGVLRIIPMFIR